MLFDNCGDGNRESPATNDLHPARKEFVNCNFAEREFFFPAGILENNQAMFRQPPWLPANDLCAYDVIEALWKGRKYYSIESGCHIFCSASAQGAGHVARFLALSPGLIAGWLGHTGSWSR